MLARIHLGKNAAPHEELDLHQHAVVHCAMARFFAAVRRFLFG